MNICEHNKIAPSCVECIEGKRNREKKQHENPFNTRQKQLFIDLKEQEKILGSISPRLSLYEETKKRIAEIQKKINESA